MSVIDFNPKPIATATYEMNNHSFTFSWDAETDNPLDTCDTVRWYYQNNVLGGGLFYNGTVLKTIQVNQHSDYIYNLTSTFATMTPWEAAKRTTLPLDRPSLIDNLTDEVDVIADYDVEGNPIYNYAGDPFTPAPTRKVYLSTIRVVKNFGNWSQPMANSYKGTTNANSLFGFPIGALLCTECTAKPATEVINQGGQDIPFNFWESTWMFKSNTIYPWYWQLAILNKGTRQLLRGKKVPVYVDTNDQSVIASEPMFLAPGGQQLPTGVNAGTNQIMLRTIYAASDFSPFNLES